MSSRSELAEDEPCLRATIISATPIRTAAEVRYVIVENAEPPIPPGDDAGKTVFADKRASETGKGSIEPDVPPGSHV